jgi:hypothetical protein
MRWVRVVYILGFIDGALAHLRYLIQGGLHTYSYAPLPIQVLFHALLLIDALTAWLIVRRRPGGVSLAVAVMAADLAANWWVEWPAFIADPTQAGRLFTLVLLSTFGLFVFTTAVALRRAFQAAAAISEA